MATNRRKHSMAEMESMLGLLEEEESAFQHHLDLEICMAGNQSLQAQGLDLERIDCSPYF